MFIRKKIFKLRVEMCIGFMNRVFVDNKGERKNGYCIYVLIKEKIIVYLYCYCF